MIRRWLNGTPSRSIPAAAFLVGGMALVSRALGLLRDRVLAGEFGAGELLDTYYVAFRLPDLMFNLLIVGAISAGFIPVFTGVWQADTAPGRPRAWQLVTNLMIVVVVSVGLAAAVLAFFSLPLTRLFTPGFRPEQVAHTAALTRIMLFGPMLLGLSAVVGGVLQSRKMFFHVSLAPIVYNAGIIMGALFLVPAIGVAGLAWGVVAGAALHVAAQLPALAGLGFRWQWGIPWRDRELGRLLYLMGPRTLSLAVTQLNLLVVTMVASHLSAGSLAVFNFANNLQSLPVGIFGIAFAIAAFPALAEVAHDRQRFVATLSQTFREIVFCIVPAMALMLVLRAQVVRVVLGSGRFDWEDTVLTMNAVGMFSLSLIAQATIPLVIRAFYARQDTLTPFFSALAAAVVNVVLTLTLAPLFGVAGVALAYSLANVLHLAVLGVMLRLSLQTLDGPRVLAALGKMAGAVTVMVAAMQGSKYLIAPVSGTQTFLGVSLQITLAATVGLTAYLGMSLLLRSPEAWALLDACRRRLRGATVTEVVSDTPTT